MPGYEFRDRHRRTITMKIKYVFGPKTGEESHERNDIAAGLIRSGIAVACPAQSLADQLRSQPRPERVDEWAVVRLESERARPAVLHKTAIKGQLSGGCATYFTGLPEHCPAACPNDVRKTYTYEFVLWAKRDERNALAADALKPPRNIDPTLNPNYEQIVEKEKRAREAKARAKDVAAAMREATKQAEKNARE
jgi:hypothetical protein